MIYIILFKDYSKPQLQYWLKAYKFSKGQLHATILSLQNETHFDHYIDYNIYKLIRDPNGKYRLSKIAYIHLGILYTF